MTVRTSSCESGNGSRCPGIDRQIETALFRQRFTFAVRERGDRAAPEQPEPVRKQMGKHGLAGAALVANDADNMRHGASIEARLMLRGSEPPNAPKSGRIARHRADVLTRSDRRSAA